MNISEIAASILIFWFGPTDSPEYGQPKGFWFNSTPEIDRRIAQQFENSYNMASSGEMSSMMTMPEGSLALVILLDQFPRNMYRGTPAAFKSDELALSVAKHAIEMGYDQKLPVFQKKFLYMPFMHTESLSDQDQGVELFRSLNDEDSVKYMTMHRDIIARFGRFPHRNQILGRESTPEEIEFLKGPNSSF
jgi:uncharacterized protein (DUF924 family)